MKLLSIISNFYYAEINCECIRIIINYHDLDKYVIKIIRIIIIMRIDYITI